jgi:alkylhydroperoxidase family enzyme
MLEYAEKLTRAPSTVRRADVDALRAAGFRDADVLAIVQVVGYFAYVNRLADGLGVELEAERPE